MNSDRAQRLSAFVDWTGQHITGDEKGQAQIFLDRLFQAFGQRGLLEVGGTPEFRIKPGKEDMGGTAFADYVWKRVGAGVLVEMKKRGEDGGMDGVAVQEVWHCVEEAEMMVRGVVSPIALVYAEVNELAARGAWV